MKTVRRNHAPMWVLIALAALALPRPAAGIPIRLPLDKAVAQADLIVVGKLGELKAVDRAANQRGVPPARGKIAVTEVLKGPAGLTEVTLQTRQPSVGPPPPGAVDYHQGAEGVWLLRKLEGEQNVYYGGNPTSLQPLSMLDEVRKLVGGPAGDPSVEPLVVSAEELAALIEQLDAPDYRKREAATEKLVRVGRAARPALEPLAGDRGEKGARAKAILERIAANEDARIRAQITGGRAVLMAFWHWGDIKTAGGGRPTEQEFVRGKKAIHDRIVAGLKAAGVKLVDVVSETTGSEQGLTYSAMMLLDCQDKEPAEALKDVPHRLAGIVFLKGHYERALPVQNPPKWLPRVEAGQVPARYAFKRWGSALGERQVDQARFASLECAKVEIIPSSGASGDGGSAKLTPAHGHTLLEVFLRSGAGFDLVAPSQVAGKQVLAAFQAYPVGTPGPGFPLFDAAMPEGPAQVDPEFLEHLRYEDQPEPEPPWDD